MRKVHVITHPDVMIDPTEPVPWVRESEVSMPESTTLTCPSCGGKLELPDNAGTARCPFCGAEILASPARTEGNQQELARYRELRYAALKAGNYKEAIEYCNRTLQIDPNDAGAWILKALAVCNLSTDTDDRHEEAIACLRHAARLTPEDEKIPQAYDYIVYHQAMHYARLAQQSMGRALDLVTRGLDPTKSLVEAMDWALKALECRPGDLQGLEALEATAEAGKMLGIQWGSAVQSQLDALASLRAKAAAEERLPRLRAELGELQSTLARLKSQGGLSVSGEIERIEAAIQKAQSEIASCEKAAAFNIPKPRL